MTLTRAALFITLAFLLASLPQALANHPQSAHGDTLVFDHRTGNEWWVEVTLGGGAAASVAGVKAMDTGGPWVGLTKRSWGAWAGSFHVEPGNRVMFQASWAGGDVVDSCWFTHPAGLEQCGTPPPSTFDAQFSNVKGNNWWVEARVTGNQPIAAVDARINCAGEWRSLTLRSWGSWAASFQIASGATIDFRARSPDGSSDLSGGYVWPQATPTTGCGAPPPPTPFRAEFVNVRGNVNWAETDVTANQPVAKVQMRMDGARWFNMTKTSWGSWARSGDYFGLPRVEFRAIAADGRTDVSYQAWLWEEPPQRYPLGGRNTPLEFHELAGDLDNVKVNTFSLYRLIDVHYRTNGEPWRPMAMDADGEWTARTPRTLPTGQHMEFMASWLDPGTGQPVSASSLGHTWPPWPQEDGFAEYRFRYEVDFHNGDYKLREGTVRFTFLPGGPGEDNWGTWSGRWTAVCSFTNDEYVAASDTWTNVTESGGGGFSPFGPRITSVGSGAQVYSTFWGCQNALHRVRVESRGPYTTEVMWTRTGTPVIADTWRGVDYPEAAEANHNAEIDIRWETNTGLVVAWDVRIPHPDADITNTASLIGSSALDG